MTGSTALNAARRTAELAALADGEAVDVVVIGGGITGTGIALGRRDARAVASCWWRSTTWRSAPAGGARKLVHGGLRYLATGNVGIARRSAIERGILMTRNAPHLVKAMPQLVPLLPSMNCGGPGAGAHRVRGRRRTAQAGGHAVLDAAAVPAYRQRPCCATGSGGAPRRA